MIYNNRNYPHPVLGITDDFTNGQLLVNLNVSSNGEFIKITPIFILENNEIEAYIKNDTAIYISHVYCRGTLYREVFQTQKKLSDPIIIPSSKLNGEVEIDFFICASKKATDYYSKSFNEEYNDNKFQIDKADIIAYAGKGKFYANKTFAELKSISSLMNVDCTGKNNEPMYLDYNGQKITIMLSIEDYHNYKLLKNNKSYYGLLLSSMVLPALIEAIHYLDDSTSKDYKENAWYKSLKEIKDDSKKYPDPLRIAQNILENPLNKCFHNLTIDEAYD